MIRNKWRHNLHKPLGFYKVSNSNIDVKESHDKNCEKLKVHRALRRIQLMIASIKNMIEIVFIYLF